MTEDFIRSIGKERLASWLEQVVSNHATPIMLVSCGHDERLGELHICVTEDMPDALLLGAAEFLVSEVRKRVRPAKNR